MRFLGPDLIGEYAGFVKHIVNMIICTTNQKYVFFRGAAKCRGAVCGFQEDGI
jgi:hypothetical protein